MHVLREPLSIQRKGFKINRAILLIIGLVSMYLFVAVGLPFFSQLVGFSEEHQVIIEEDIHAGEWFYIFVEQIKEIEPRVAHTLRYTPGMVKADQ